MYQQLTIIGRLGKDPEMRYTPSGTPVCTFNVATDRVWNDAQGQRQEETTWHRVTAWNKQAELCAQYLSKGSMVLVTGSVKAQGYIAREGGAAASLEVRLDIVKFLSTRQAEGMALSSNNSSAVPTEEDIPF